MRILNLDFGTARDSKNALDLLKNLFSEYFPWMLVTILYVVAGFFLPDLFKIETFMTVLVQSTPVVVLSIALSFSLIVGEFDLSIVGTLLFAPLIGILATQAGAPAILGMLVTIGTGILIGIWNGLVITRIGVPSLIQTLAAWWILEGAVLSQTRARSIAVFPSLYDTLGSGSLGPVRNVIIVTIVIVLTMWYYTTRVVSGRRLYLVGGDREASNRMGLSESRYIMYAFVMSAILSSLAGLILVTRVGVMSVDIGRDLLLPAIAAPVISGVLLTGGEGKIINVPAGAVLVQLILIITRIGGVSTYQFTLVQGLLVFLAIILNEVRKRGLPKPGYFKEFSHEFGW